MCVCVCIHCGGFDVAGADDGANVAEVSQQQVEDLGGSLPLQAIQLLQLSQLPLHRQQQRLYETHSHVKLSACFMNVRY